VRKRGKQQVGHPPRGKFSDPEEGDIDNQRKDGKKELSLNSGFANGKKRSEGECNLFRKRPIGANSS